jgi:hypothetical protein
MKLSNRSWLFALVILIAGSTSVVAQTRIQLVQGRRAVKDTLKFVVEVSREKNQNPRYATAPEALQVYTAFAAHPATGMVYVDGKALGRFDESMKFNSNPVDVSYGRHTITVVFTNPAVVGEFVVSVRGAALREVMDGGDAGMPNAVGCESRIVELDRKVRELEAEIATLKGKRAP